MRDDILELLREVPLFSALTDDDFRRMCSGVGDRLLGAGEELFGEGEPGDMAYVIADGQVEIVKATQRREILLAVRGRGEVIGEMALLQEEPRTATVRARTDARVVAIPKQTLDNLLDASPSATRSIFQIFLKRLRATNDQIRQSQRMAQLGTLTAGVAHELNNPAAAVARSADRLAGELTTLAGALAAPMSEKERAAIEALMGRTPAPITDGLARSDAEADLEEWLDAHGWSDPWEAAGVLIDAGITADDLAGLSAAGNGSPAAVRLLVATASVRQLGREIADGAGRISGIVRALKSYAYLDQSPVQDVDVQRGLEDTLMLLSHRIGRTRVVRDYAPSLPTITALGTELNQVWTNLIENACDAMADMSDGSDMADREPTLTLRTRTEDDAVVVEVEDNGPGIPDEVRPRIFDAFFTTKPPGAGSGLGLQISYRIIVFEHRGDLTVTSQPGRTVFRVLLPVAGPTDPGDRAPEGDAG